MEALEEEAMPAMVAPAPPPGRFARPGSVFAICDNGGDQPDNHNGNHPVTKPKEGLYDNYQ